MYARMGRFAGSLEIAWRKMSWPFHRAIVAIKPTLTISAGARQARCPIQVDSRTRRREAFEVYSVENRMRIQ